MLTTNYFHEGHWGQCLELLSHLCQYGDSLLLVTGPSGIGKSALKQALLEAEEDRFAICDIRATIALNAEMVDELLAVQLDHAVQDPTKGLLLLIDDAQNLSLDLVAILLQLPQKVTDANLHIVLFATKDFEQKIARSVLKEDFFEQVHLIEVEPLTVAEVETFLMHQWRNSGKDVEFLAKNAKFKKIHAMSNGIPGKVEQIAEELMPNTGSDPKPKIERHIGLSPLTVGVTVSCGILFCILALLWPAADDSLISPQNTAQNEIIAPLIETADAVTEVVAVTTPETTPESESPIVAIEVAAVPAAEAAEAAEPVAVAESPEVSAIPAAATQVMSDDEKIKRLEGKLAALQQQLHNEQQARHSTEARFQQMLQKQAVHNKSEVRKPEVAAKNRALNYTNQEEHLLAMPSSNFTLQLMGSTSESKVKTFITNNDLTGKAYYYKGVHRGKPWYVVVYGNYPSKLEAQAALAKLPSPLKKLRPWPRQYVKIHNSIKKQIGSE